MHMDNKGEYWNSCRTELLRLDTLSLNTPYIPESYSLPTTSHIPPEADTPKTKTNSFYYKHIL